MNNKVLLAACASAHEELLEDTRSPKSSYLQERNYKVRFASDFDDMINDTKVFKENFHMDLPTFLDILAKVEDLLKPKRNTHPHDGISPKHKLAIVLEYLACGSLQRHIPSCYRVSKQKFGVIIDEVCTAICTALKDQVPPMTKEELVRVSKTYQKWNFPNCIGAIDGKHVAVKCPPRSGSLFYNHKALLRPGRFDRHILIDLPNLEERKQIFEKHLSAVQLDANPKVYSKRLARLTSGFSGADIANVCNEAALHAARNVQKKVKKENLEYAVERLVGGTEKRSHALSPVERKVIAYHESGHALVGWLLPNSDVLLKVTIVPRTSLALGFAQYTPSEQQLYTKEELFDKMCMALGGRAAENIIFNSISTGAQNDLEKVTKIAYSQIKKFGMNDKLGPIYIKDSEEAEGYGKPFSKALDKIIDREARNLIAAAYQKTELILKDNRDKLDKLAKTLLEKETINYEEVVNLIGPPSSTASKRTVEPAEFEQTLKDLSEIST